MYPNLTFNNKRKDYISVLEKKRPYRAPREHDILTVPKRPGGYVSDIVVGVLVIPVRLLITAASPHLLRRTAEDLAAWFNVDEPAPLQFDDEPDRTYYAVVDGSLEPDEIVTFGYLDVDFLCPDPHKYGPERSMVFDESVETIVNNGSAPAVPIFRGQVNQQITNLDIVTLDSYMRIGAPAPIDMTPVAGRTKVINDEMGSVSGWTQASVVDNGHVSGTMMSDGNGFLAETWGPVMEPSGWQGPSLLRGVPSPLQNFTAEIDIEQFNGVDEVGMIEIYFRDSSGNVICKIGFSDEWRASKLNRAKFQVGEIGERIDFNRTADNPAHWDNFKGVLRVTRDGQNFSAYFAKVGLDNRHHTRSTITYYDSMAAFQNPVTSIQVAIRKWPLAHIPPTEMKVTKLQVWQLHETSTNEPVFIAGAGDVIEIDHEIGDITINGEPRLWLKDMGSTFFKLKPGENFITVSPAYAVDMEVFWRERFV